MFENKLGLIGVGNMGAAILGGIIDKRLVDVNSVAVFDSAQGKVRDFRNQRNVIHANSCANLVELSDVVILAIKPQDFTEMAKEIVSSITKETIVISILAGMTVERIQEALGRETRIVRAMPNMGAQVGQSITALTSKDKQALGIAEMLFSGCGKTVVLDENKFDLVTAVSGSGPAYFFYLMERLAVEAEKQGISRKEAMLLSIQTALGSAALAEASESDPGALRKMVTSKGGTTEAALEVFNQHGFESMIAEAIEAAKNRGKELSQA